MIRRIYFTLKRSVLIVLLTVLMLAACVASMGRYAMPYVTDYRPHILSWVNDLAPFSIDAKHLVGDWKGLSPILRAEQLMLGDGETALEVDSFSVQLNIPYSLWHRKLVFDQLALEGADVRVSQNSEGVWRLDADWLPKPKRKQNFISADALYAGLQSLYVGRLSVTVSLSSGAQHELDYIELDYAKQANEWRIVANALPDDSPLPINTIIEGRGLPAHDDFEFHAYALLSGFDASPYLDKLSYQSWTPQLKQFNGELWFDLNANGSIETQGIVDLKTLAFIHAEKESSVEIPELKTQFKLAMSQSGNPSVWLRDLDIQLSDETIAFEQANLLPYDEGLRASFDSIEIKPVLRLLRRFKILPAKADEALATLEPSGTLRDITLILPNTDTLKTLEVTSWVDGISVRPWKGAPGAEGVTGRMHATILGGIVALDSKELSLSFPSIYHHALEFDEAVGQVRWLLEKDKVKVQSGKLQMHSKAGYAKGYFDLDLPLDKSLGKEPQMNLAIGLMDMPVHFRNQFIPYVVGENLLNWLDESIKSGTVLDAAFVYRGSLARGAALRRTSQLYFDVRDGVLDYDKKWPRAEGLNAEVFVDDNRVLVEAKKGKVSGVRLSNAKVAFVPQPVGKGSQLEISAILNGKLDSALNFLNNSPIADTLGDALAGWQGEGLVGGRLLAKVPLGGEKKENIDVRVRIKNASLSNADLNIRFDEMNGPLRFTTNQGLSSAGLVATLWDDPISALISSEFEVLEAAKDSVGSSFASSGVLKPAKQRRWTTRIDMKGRNNHAAVLDWLNLPLHDFLEGDVSYSANLNIRSGDTNLTIYSSLQSLLSTLPAPFAKSQGAVYPMDITVLLDYKPLRIKANFPGEIKAALVLHKEKPLSGTVSFDSGVVPEFANESIRLVGKVKEFELERWLDVFSAFDVAGESATDARKKSKRPSVYAQNLMLEKAIAFGTEFSRVNSAMASHGSAMTFVVESEDIAGRVTYDTAQSSALDVSLDRLYLNTDQDSKVKRITGDSEQNSDVDKVGLLDSWYPADLPEMQLNLSDFRVDDKPFGQWSFKVSPTQHGAIFSDLTANTRGLNIAGTADKPASLRWRRVGDQQETKFQGILSCGDLSEVLAAWEYDPMIKSTNCRFNTDLSWYGSPLDINMAKMDGRVSILMNNGQFMEANSTANAMRLFSLFNFDTLLRRLQFNFSDVFNRGLSYDQITGEFLLANGTLTIDKAFDVRGPSSRLQMYGTLDLDNELVDTQMVATLPITSNLPWVAALAGGLPIAAGVYVAGKIFQKPLEKLSSASYSVKGPWDEPEIKLQRIFDDEGNKSREDITPAVPVASEPAP